jgi:protease I
MSFTPLDGKKVGILVEAQFIPDEITAYQQQFTALGAEVRLMSRLWGNQELTFVSEIEKEGAMPDTLTVRNDFTKANPDDYAAIIMAANYTSVRLRWIDDQDLAGAPIGNGSARLAPAVKFIQQAMMNPRIIKGFACHGLWILTPIPEMLAGRKVICNRVMIADVANAGGIITPSPKGVVVDGDIVTSDSVSHTNEFIEALVARIKAVEDGTMTI